ncbi:MAG TPA: N-acetylmuramoyl-L-alanine amidase [Acidisarcina sp.]|nr:N-acetylmuramoyl-L-alanine amidase [Acidisarcina sp.]
MFSPLLPAARVRHISAHAIPLSPFDKAQRMREALNGRPQQQRTRRDYERVLDAYRAVYHSDPASPRADASIAAVGDVLAEEGRIFDDDKTLHDAIGQYEFLRHQYPASRFCATALLTEAAIYHRDIGDKDEAKTKYQQFLKAYPRSPLADQARAGLKELRNQQIAEKHGSRSGKNKPEPAEDTAAKKNGRAANAEQTRKEDQVLKDASPSSLPSQQTTVLPQTTPSKTKQTSSSAASEPQPLAPIPSSAVTDTSLATPAHTRRGKTPLVTNIRHWSTNVYTRVAIDLDEEVQYEAARVPNPDRIFFDLHGVKLSPELIGRSVEVTDDGYLKRIRAAQFSNDVTRIVLDVSDVSEYSAFLLPNPYRLIIDIHGRKPGSPATTQTATTEPPPSAPAGGNAARRPLASSTNTSSTTTSSTTTSSTATALAQGSRAGSTSSAASGTMTGITSGATTSGTTSQPHTPASASQAAPATTRSAATNIPTSLRGSTLPQATAQPPTPRQSASATKSEDSPSRRKAEKKSSSLDEVAALSQQKNRVQATTHPTSAPISASVADTTPAPQSSGVDTPAAPPTGKSRSRKHASTSRSTEPSRSEPDTNTLASVSHEAAPTANGERSLVRALGLKIGRIVVDAGHGGHDSGTLGPEGIEEKEVVLDVALRLGKLLKQRLGADVIYTRDDDTFIPLETRTAIANKAQADLFISVHANSSHDPTARGVETYYLNFTASPDALEVAARENAVSNQSIHQLSDLVKKITLKDKIDESREFATDVQQNLFAGLEDGNRGLKDRGVKKAPFVVLIGANMPSILAEISFLTNPEDARELRDPNYRQRIAESLYHGVSKYVGGLSGVQLAKSRAGGN